MSDQSQNNIGKSVVSQKVLHQFLQSNNYMHHLGALPMAIQVQLLVKAVMSRDLSAVYIGSVCLYNLRKDGPRGSTVEIKVGKIRISVNRLHYTVEK